MTMQHPPIGATALGFPRIGRDRELKKALDSYWSGTISGTDLEEVATAVRADALDSMSRAGLETVPVNTFSWYDHVLDAAVLVGAVPSASVACPATTGSPASTRLGTSRWPAGRRRSLHWR